MDADHRALLRRAGGFLGEYVCIELEGESAVGWLVGVETLNEEGVWWLSLDWGWSMQLTHETKITLTTPESEKDSS